MCVSNLARPQGASLRPACQLVRPLSTVPVWCTVLFCAAPPQASVLSQQQATMALNPSQDLHRPARAWHSRRQSTFWPFVSCPHEQHQRAVICAASSQKESRRRPFAPGVRVNKPAQTPKPPKPQPASLKPQPEEEIELPEMGWLWTVGEKKTGRPEQVSAKATVADLRQDRIQAKKSLGQNFLTDDGILKDIVQAAGVKKGDLVLEVGPGTGNLTKHLISTGAQVTAVEKDDTLYARLTETYAQTPSLKLVHDDVLRLDVIGLIQQMISPGDANQTGILNSSNESSQQPQPLTSSASTSPTTTMSTVSPSKGKVKVVANLPYNITTDFLKKLLPAGDYVSELHIMLQEEAGVRLVKSAPGDRDYRAMSLRVALYSKAVYRFCISKTKYFPEPGVDGALITFKLIPPSSRLPVPSERGLLRAIEKAFNERRKMLRNSLQPLYSVQQVESCLAGVGLPLTVRAQDLDIKQWAALYSALHTRSLEDDLRLRNEANTQYEDEQETREEDQPCT